MGRLEWSGEEVTTSVEFSAKSTGGRFLPLLLQNGRHADNVLLGDLETKQQRGTGDGQDGRNNEQGESC